jgi:hypothetical protein
MLAYSCLQIFWRWALTKRAVCARPLYEGICEDAYIYGHTLVIYETHQQNKYPILASHPSPSARGSASSPLIRAGVGRAFGFHSVSVDVTSWQGAVSKGAYEVYTKFGFLRILTQLYSRVDVSIISYALSIIAFLDCSTRFAIIESRELKGPLLAMASSYCRPLVGVCRRLLRA